MSAPLRSFLVGSALVFGVLVLNASRAPSAPAPPAAPQFKPFADDLVARAQPLPPLGAPAWDRMGQQLASVDAMWRPLFAAAGERYESPHLVQVGEDGCDAPPAAGAWAGIYCTGTRNIVVDPDGHALRQAHTGGYVADVVLAYIVAHEVGHHVQVLRGAPMTSANPRHELHADCLAGVWGKAAGLPLPPTWKYAADAEHGTSGQRMRWLSRGHLHGRPADCDAIFAGEPL